MKEKMEGKALLRLGRRGVVWDDKVRETNGLQGTGRRRLGPAEWVGNVGAAGGKHI